MGLGESLNYRQGLNFPKRLNSIKIFFFFARNPTKGGPIGPTLE